MVSQPVLVRSNLLFSQTKHYLLPFLNQRFYYVALIKTRESTVLKPGNPCWAADLLIFDNKYLLLPVPRRSTGSKTRKQKNGHQENIGRVEQPAF